MGNHLVGGEFQSDKYPWCARGFVPLKVTDKGAQYLLWEYAQTHRARDPEFSADLDRPQERGFVPDESRPILIGVRSASAPPRYSAPSRLSSTSWRGSATRGSRSRSRGRPRRRHGGAPAARRREQVSVPKRWHVGRELDQAFIDALRECLGLAPLFRGPQPEVERSTSRSGRGCRRTA